jgi:adenylosuccinate synthase
LGFGDEGKGTIADFLARYYDIKTVVRDNGGPQAAHNVVDQNGRQHVFSQFGSATLIGGSTTYLSDGMLVQPVNLLRENRSLVRIGIPDAMERIFIDPDCPIVTPIHQMLGRMLEISRGRNRFGSVGMGVGQAVLDREENKSLTFRDAIDKTMLGRKLETHIEEKIGQAKNLSLLHPKNEELALTFQQYSGFATFKRLNAFYANFVRRFRGVFQEPEAFFDSPKDKHPIFEGAQGTLLDPVCGFPPYVTKTRTTAITAERLIRQYLPSAKTKKVGIIRACYMTRHGAGVFVTQDPGLTNFLPDSHNRRHRWQGNFRAGWLDLLALRYACGANNGLDSLAVTNLDRASGLKRIKICTAYLYEGKHLGDLGEFFESGQSRKISAFLPPKTRTNQEKLTSLLFNCRPAEYRIFQGWQKNISAIRSFDRLPREAKEFIGFLESEEGLNVPISVISVGERSDQKFMHNPLL